MVNRGKQEFSEYPQLRKLWTEPFQNIVNTINSESDEQNFVNTIKPESYEHGQTGKLWIRAILNFVNTIKPESYEKRHSGISWIPPTYRVWLAIGYYGTSAAPSLAALTQELGMTVICIDSEFHSQVPHRGAFESWLGDSVTRVN